MDDLEELDVEYQNLLSPRLHDKSNSYLKFVLRDLDVGPAQQMEDWPSFTEKEKKIHQMLEHFRLEREKISSAIIPQIPPKPVETIPKPVETIPKPVETIPKPIQTNTANTSKQILQGLEIIAGNKDTQPQSQLPKSLPQAILPSVTQPVPSITIVGGNDGSVEAIAEFGFYGAKWDKMLNVFKNMPTNHPKAKSVALRIRASFNQLSQKRGQIISKSQILSQLLNELKNDPGLFNYALDQFGQNLMRQSSVQVVSNPEASYTFAYVTVNVCYQHPELMQFLLGMFHNYCPYTVPMLKQRGKESDKDYKVNVLKYKVLSQPGEQLDIEEPDTYSDRMVGIMYVYSAILVIGATHNKTGTEGFHSYKDLWAWIARLLNLPYQEIYADLLLAFLKQSAFFMYRHYKDKFATIMNIIEKEFIPKIARDTSRTRLQLFVTSCKNPSQLREPDGYLLVDEAEPDFDKFGEGEDDN